MTQAQVYKRTSIDVLRENIAYEHVNQYIKASLMCGSLTAFQ
jgi:hypothetical protein